MKGRKQKGKKILEVNKNKKKRSKDIEKDPYKIAKSKRSNLDEKGIKEAGIEK